jgi:hypothetical protein
MAKQTFTTGQVLTAAQMTSLQQTAMGGGSPSTKTVSYVLTAADAGTVIQMNSASATTITVNTALFSAGDSVQIQNINTGVVTITAGTATVTTSGSLALSQWEGGFLYFTSASASIFFDYTQTGAVSPLTTKGDVWGYSTLDARIPVGANDTVLTADSTQALGLKWATPSSGGMTLLSTTSLTTAETTISGISGSYTDLQIIVTNVVFNAGANTLNLRLNALVTGGDYDDSGSSASQVLVGSPSGSTANPLLGRITINRYASSDARKFITAYSNVNGTSTSRNAFVKTASAIDTVVLRCSASTFFSGTAYIYGVK